MTEVIAYLIEHFQDFDNCPPPEDLGRLLEDAGFDATEIGNTLMMMEVLFIWLPNTQLLMSNAKSSFTP